MDANLNFRDAERFQIVPVFGGRYWINCYNPAQATGDMDAQAYVGWLSRKTGKSYRLLSEAAREYVTRAGHDYAILVGIVDHPSCGQLQRQC